MTDEKDQQDQTDKKPEETTKEVDEVKEATPAKKEIVEVKEEKPEPSGKFKDVIKQIEELSVKDLAVLVKELEDRFGVSAAAPIALMGAGDSSVSAAAEEKLEYSVILTDAGAQKIAVIKAVREVRPDLGLKEAKDLVDSAPKEVKTNVPTEEAKVAKEKLEAAGAKVELK